MRQTIFSKSPGKISGRYDELSLKRSQSSSRDEIPVCSLIMKYHFRDLDFSVNTIAHLFKVSGERVVDSKTTLVWI